MYIATVQFPVQSTVTASSVREMARQLGISPCTVLKLLHKRGRSFYKIDIRKEPSSISDNVISIAKDPKLEGEGRAPEVHFIERPAVEESEFDK